MRGSAAEEPTEDPGSLSYYCLALVVRPRESADPESIPLKVPVVRVRLPSSDTSVLLVGLAGCEWLHRPLNNHHELAVVSGIYAEIHRMRCKRHTQRLYSSGTMLTALWPSTSLSNV